MRYFADYIKGKPYQRTVLWENSSPTSAFANQTLTLLDDITNYDFLRVSWRYQQADAMECYEDIPVADFIANGADLTYGTKYVLGIYGGVYAVRTVTYATNTTIVIGTATRVGGTNTYTNCVIPLKIVGIKKGIGEVGKKERYEWMIQNPVAEYNVGFKPKQLIVSLMYNNSQNMTFVYDEDYSTTRWRRYYASSVDEYSLQDTSVAGLYDITDTGFVLTQYLQYYKYMSYIALG